MIAYPPYRAASIPVNTDPNVVGGPNSNVQLDMNGNPSATSLISSGSAGNFAGSTTSGGGGGGFWDFGGFGDFGGGGGDYYDDGGGLIYNGGYGNFGGSGGSSGGSGLNPFLTGLGGLAIGSALSRGGSASSVQRNLPNEISGLASLAPGLAGSTVGSQLQLNPLVTAGNVANFNSALAGVAPGMRDAYNAANPQLAAYTQGLGATLAGINAQGAPRYDATGYQAAISDTVQAGPAAQARAMQAQLYQTGPAARAGSAAMAQFNPATAYTAGLSQAQAQTAGQQRASGGPLLNTLQSQAMQSVGGVSELQARQQQIAMGLLGGSGGDLTAQDLRNVQQDTRGAYAARGLYDSNQAIGAEIMNSDAARRQRLTQNLGIAQGVDAAGQQQIGATRNFALGVQNQGQNLSQFNAGQGNSLATFNTGQVNDTSRFNAQQGNANSQFNAGLLTQNSQFNSSGNLQASLANQGAQNQFSMFDANNANQFALANMQAGNANSQFNANLGTNVNLQNMGARNSQSQFNAGLGQSNLQFNAGQNNAASAFNAGVTNQSNQWNAAAAGQNQNDQWARAMQLGGFYQGQSLNPTATAMGLVGQAPDYTNGLLGYGSDLYGSNANAQSAANISRNNNNAALASAGLGLLYQFYNGSNGGYG